VNIFTAYNSQELKIYSIMMQVKIICQMLQIFFVQIGNVFISSKNNLISYTLICIFFNDMMVFDYLI
jgi:hypothetical protein